MTIREPLFLKTIAAVKQVFNVGDTVVIDVNVHDDQMPPFDRKGNIVKIVGKRRDQALVMFSNKCVLKFHFCQIEKFYKTVT